MKRLLLAGLLAFGLTADAQPLMGGLLGRGSAYSSFTPPTGCVSTSIPFFLASPLALGCDAGLTYDAATDALTVTGLVRALNLCEGVSNLSLSVGSTALPIHTYTSGDTAIGALALNQAGYPASGGRNTAIGSEAMKSLVNGGDNTAIGQWAMANSTDGGGNVAIGGTALTDAVGYNNIAIGYQAGTKTFGKLINGNANIFIGYNTGVANEATTYTNMTVIGYDLAGSADNTVYLGSASVTDVILGTGLAKAHARGLRLTTGVRPTCDAAARGTVWYVAGAGGVADTFEVCGKAAADTYSWKAIVTF